MILITGGLGFLGGRITKHLRQNGFKVRVGSRIKSAETILMDFTNDLSLENSCKGVTHIIHLAGMNAQSSEIDPELSLTINGLGTLKLLKAAEIEGVSSFIFFSTVHVYGSPLCGEIDENSLLKPSSPYSISKRVAEDYVLEANKNISTTIFRLTNAVGSPVLKDSNCWMLVANDLCHQVVTSKNMNIYASEFVQRDFIPISGVCNAVHSSLLLDNSSGGVFNLSSGASLSLRELSNIIVDRSKIVLGYKPSVSFINKEVKENFKELTISNSKLRESGIKTEVNLTKEIDSMLTNCVEWFL